TASELAAAGYQAGSMPTTIGWNYTTGTAGTAPLIVYMQNTADTTNTKSTTWTTAIGGMTLVHNGTMSVPASGPMDITMTGGSPFTYTGGGLYIAFDWGSYPGTLNTANRVFVTTAGTATTRFGISNTAAPASIANNFAIRPETRLNGALTTPNDVAVTAVYS